MRRARRTDGVGVGCPVLGFGGPGWLPSRARLPCRRRYRKPPLSRAFFFAGEGSGVRVTAMPSRVGFTETAGVNGVFGQGRPGTHGYLPRSIDPAPSRLQPGYWIQAGCLRPGGATGPSSDRKAGIREAQGGYGAPPLRTGSLVWRRVCRQRGYGLWPSRGTAAPAPHCKRSPVRGGLATASPYICPTPRLRASRLRALLTSHDARLTTLHD
jgi:hypothetical protein